MSDSGRDNFENHDNYSDSNNSSSSSSSSSSYSSSSSSSSSSSPSSQGEEANETRKEIRTAEAKIEWGIKYLYEESKRYARFDEQGVASVVFEPKSFNREVDTPFGRTRLGDLFPNGLQNGVTVHFFAKDYIRHPAAFNMVQQKIRSLCHAAKLPPINIINADLIAQQLEGIFRKELEEKTHEIKADNKKYPSAKEKTAAFHAIVVIAMKNAAANAAKMLYDKYRQSSNNASLDFAHFSKQLLHTSAHHRTDTHDILTFNTGTQHFSYDEAASVTAHDRIIGNGCANLSIAIEGNYQYVEKNTDFIKTHINNTLVKHASPVATDAIGKSDIKEIDLISDTCKNFLEVANTMARLRLHGRRAEDRHKPMKIEWVYQILTTNAANRDKQAPTYEYVTRAARLLNHSQLQLGETPVSLNISVLNAGINKLGGVGSVPKLFKLFSKLIHKSDTQRQENRHAYRQLTNAVETINVDVTKITDELDQQVELDRSVQLLKNLLLSLPQHTEAEAIKSYRAVAALNQKIANNSQKFVGLQTHKIALEKSLADLKQEEQSSADLNNGGRSKTKQAMIDELENEIQKITNELEACDIAATANYSALVVQSNLTEGHQRDNWKIHRPYVEFEVHKLKRFLEENNDKIQARLNDPKTAEATTEQLQSILALIYKAYADQLYFGTGEDKYEEAYRTPEKAAIFNAYIMLFQYMTPGMMGSIGCKSANDRTMVMRLLIAGLAEAPGAPQSLHHQPLGGSDFIKKLNDMVMTNSALFATNADTQGGTPKVDVGKFPYLDGIDNLKTVSHFGEYAPHKMVIELPSQSQHSHATETNNNVAYKTLGKENLFKKAVENSSSSSSSSSSSHPEENEEQEEVSKNSPKKTSKNSPKKTG